MEIGKWQSNCSKDSRAQDNALYSHFIANTVCNISHRNNEPRSAKCHWPMNSAWSCWNARARVCAAFVLIQGQMCPCEDEHRKILSSYDENVLKTNTKRRMRTNVFVWEHRLSKRALSIVWVLFVVIPRRTKKHPTSGLLTASSHLNEMNSYLLTEKNNCPYMRRSVFSKEHESSPLSTAKKFGKVTWLWLDLRRVFTVSRKECTPQSIPPPNLHIISHTCFFAFKRDTFWKHKSCVIKVLVAAQWECHAFPCQIWL